MCSQGISQFYLHTHTFIRNRNEPYLPLPSQLQLVLIYRPRRDGRLSRPWYEVSLSEIRTRNLLIANPALYHIASSTPSDTKLYCFVTEACVLTCPGLRLTAGLLEFWGCNHYDLGIMQFGLLLRLYAYGVHNYEICPLLRIVFLLIAVSHPFLAFLCLFIQAPALVCISIQLIVIQLCYREVSYSVYYTTSTRYGCHQQINSYLPDADMVHFGLAHSH